MMKSQRLRIMVDHRVLKQFIESTRFSEDEEAKDFYADNEQSASRLLVMLASIGEFRVFTTASQMERLCEWLFEANFAKAQADWILSKLEGVLDVVPVESAYLKRALANSADFPFDVKVTAAVAEVMGIPVTVSTGALNRESNVGRDCGDQGRKERPFAQGLDRTGSQPLVLTPAAFFHEVKTRYGFDYAELSLH